MEAYGKKGYIRKWSHTAKKRYIEIGGHIKKGTLVEGEYSKKGYITKWRNT